METSGFDKARYDLNIGVQSGDCLDVYSLEKSAGLPHPMKMPRPRCAIIFILKEENEETQAQWILNTLGKTYKTASGRNIFLCSQVNKIGPFPGVIIHN